MHLSPVQDLAIQALTANLVGAEEFDRLFLGVEFIEVEGDILFVGAPSEEAADEIEQYWEELAAIATRVLGQPVGLVMVLPRLRV
ncbi:hypothetical protein [Tardiphaga sp. 768_D3_N2_1]|jgi:hypothetical protein|uniref:hypothetical protein n=1 Tax=Tardiphaga sp. 768_D3_N2_1 TaxID=3240783 RepID=UPI003F8CD732